MKLGLDFHKVITDNPKFFAELSKMYIDAGHEVHIITGRRVSEELVHILKEFGIKYTHIFSICDYHLRLGTHMTGYDNNKPILEDSVWDRTKAEYCAREEIALHIDDSDVYGRYFTTSYLKYNPKGGNDVS